MLPWRLAWSVHTTPERVRVAAGKHALPRLDRTAISISEIDYLALGNVAACVVRYVETIEYIAVRRVPACGQ